MRSITECVSKFVVQQNQRIESTDVSDDSSIESTGEDFSDQRNFNRLTESRSQLSRAVSPGLYTYQ